MTGFCKLEVKFCGPNQRKVHPAELADRQSEPLVHTVAPATLIVGMRWTVMEPVAVALQPFAEVTVKLYTPLLLGVTENKMGCKTEELNPIGPLHLFVLPP